MNNETESSLNFEELKKELERLLADTIVACMDRVGIALVENCRKWAQSLEDDKKEEKLLNAIYVAGRSKRLLEWKEFPVEGDDDGVVDDDDSPIVRLDIDVDSDV